MVEILRSVIGLFLLGIGAWFDIKEKVIPLMLPAVGAFIGIIVLPGSGISYFPDILFGLIPGAFLLLAAFITEQKIGYGDGVIVCALGVLVIWELCFVCLIAALFLQSVCAVLLLALKKIGLKSRLPFIPFLCISYVFLLGVW